MSNIKTCFNGNFGINVRNPNVSLDVSGQTNLGILKSTSILDSTNSSGLSDYVLSSGVAGGSLLWKQISLISNIYPAAIVSGKSTLNQIFNSGLTGSTTQYLDYLSILLSQNDTTRVVPAGSQVELDDVNKVWRVLPGGDGIYRISINIGVGTNSGTGNFRVMIVKNGSRFFNPPTNSFFWAYTGCYPSSVVPTSCTLDWTTNLIGGDTITAQVNQQSAITNITFSNGASFSIQKIQNP